MVVKAFKFGGLMVIEMQPNRGIEENFYWGVGALGSRGWAFDWHKFERPNTPKIGGISKFPLYITAKR